MTVKLSLSSVAPERARCDVLAVGVYADRKLTPSAQALDKVLGGALARQAADADFKGGLGSGWTITAGEGVNAKAVLLVGLGKRGRADARRCAPGGRRRREQATQPALGRGHDRRRGARVDRRRRKRSAR